MEHSGTACLAVYAALTLKIAAEKVLTTKSLLRSRFTEAPTNPEELQSDLDRVSSTSISLTKPSNFQNLLHFNNMGLPLNLTSNFLRYKQEKGIGKSTLVRAQTLAEKLRAQLQPVEEGEIVEEPLTNTDPPTTSIVVPQAKYIPVPPKSFAQIVGKEVSDLERFGKVDWNGDVPVAVFTKSERE